MKGEGERMKLLIEPLARFKLERLCDYKHPQEVGGKLLGQHINGAAVVKDIFAIPNSSQEPNRNYSSYSPYEYFLPLYEKMVSLQSFGQFHSHPNGTIPSESDMRACNGLNLWVIHHRIGEHTFAGSKDYQHLEVILLNEVQEKRVIGFRGNRFFLGDIEVDDFGRIITDEKTLELLQLPEKTRKAFIKFLQYKDRWGEVETKVLAEALNVTNQTVRKWLRKASKLVKLLKHGVKEK